MPIGEEAGGAFGNVTNCILLRLINLAIQPWKFERMNFNEINKFHDLRT